MKIKFTHYITAICIAFMSFTAQAQSKVSHIDFNKLVSEMPEYIAAMEEVKKLMEDYNKEITASEKELETKYQNYAVDSENQTCLLYTSPSPRDLSTSRMPSSA